MNERWHALVFSLISTAFLLVLHKLPVNQVFIDPFSEYIRHQDLMDISCSKFRDHLDPSLVDNRIFIINSKVTDRAKLLASLDFLQRRKVRVVAVDLMFDSLAGHEMDKVASDANGYPGAGSVTSGAGQDGFFHHLTESCGNMVFAKIFDHGTGQETLSDEYLVPRKDQYFVNLGSDDGYTVRSFDPVHKFSGKGGELAFPVAVAALYDSTSLTDLMKRGQGREWINFRRFQSGTVSRSSGRKRSLSHYQVIGLDRFVSDTSDYPDDYFSDKIVMVGFCGNDDSESLRDKYFTPLNEFPAGRSLPDMHGVVVHANIISMILDRDYVDEMSSWSGEWWVFAIFLLNYFLFLIVSARKFFFNLALVRLLQVLQFVILFSVGIWLLSGHSFKVNFVLLVTAVILSYELWEFYSHKLKRRVDMFPVWLKELDLKSALDLKKND